MIAPASEWTVTPELFPRRSIDGEQNQLRRGAVKHAINNDRTALNLRATVGAFAAGLIRPRDFKLVDVLGVDLFERRIMATRVVAEIRRPIGRFGSTRGDGL